MRVYRDDHKFINFRINAFLWTIVAVFLFLAGSFWYVQAVEGNTYKGLSEANALREQVTSAKRGLIYARDDASNPGKVAPILADNQAAYRLSIDRSVLKTQVKGEPAHRAKLTQFLSAVLGIAPPDMQIKMDKAKTIPATQPFILADDLSMTQVATLQAQSVSFPEINVDPIQRRNYPYGIMAAHVLGFIGEASEKDLQNRKDLRAGDLLGKRGVELMYDSINANGRQYGLRGKDGSQFWEYDSHGRRLAEYRAARREPIAGDNIHLTIDFELQRRAEQYFIENEFVGSAVALDPTNGEVLAMVSSPAFNPNTYSRRFAPETWKTIASNPFKIELNRAIQGLYSPGSVFKAVVGIGGLSEGVIDTSTSFFCGGSAVFFGRRFRCYNKNGHGDVTVANALKVSCDIFFYNTGSRLNVDRIAKYAKQLSFGDVTGIDLDGEKAGIVPSTEWANTKQHRKWYPSETVSVAIGQGPLIVTPLQVACMMGAIANGGKVYRPHVLQRIEHRAPDGKIENLKIEPSIIHQVQLNQKALDAVRLGLWKVVNEQGGTGSNARVAGLDVSGKTGTVQVIAQHGWVKTEGLPFRSKDHAWFASYAPRDNPRMVVVVFVEHGGHGGVDSAPLAKLLYEAKFAKDVQDVHLDLNDPEVLEKIKEGQLPQPGQVVKPPSQTSPGLGH